MRGLPGWWVPFDVYLDRRRSEWVVEERERWIRYFECALGGTSVTARRSAGGELWELHQGARGKHDPLAGVALAAPPFHPNVLIASEKLDHSPHGIEGRVAELNQVADLKSGVSKSHGHTVHARRRTRYWTLVLVVRPRDATPLRGGVQLRDVEPVVRRALGGFVYLSSSRCLPRDGGVRALSGQSRATIVAVVHFAIGCLAWFAVCAVLMSFVEHSVHRHLMHKRNILSRRLHSFNKTFEHHAILHHGHYSKIFSDEPAAPGEDRHVRLSIREGFLEALPVAALLAVFSLQGAIIFELVVCSHHFVWNKIHLEMHKPEHRFFSGWSAYKFLARHHYLHHKYPTQNFNVVLPFADYVVGTNVRASRSDLNGMDRERIS